MRRFTLKIAALAALLPLLAGCFTSTTSLISPGEADFPFASITYVAEDDDATTLKREGDAYINPADKKKSRVLLKKVADSAYVVQTSVSDDGKEARLFAFVTVAPDRKSFTQSHGVATAAALEAAQAGKFGFGICEGEDDVICITSVEGYGEFAMSTPDAQAKTLKITSWE